MTLLSGDPRSHAVRTGRIVHLSALDRSLCAQAVDDLDTKDLRNVLLSGSVSRDNAGRFCVVGWAKAATGDQRPLVLQISVAP